MSRRTLRVNELLRAEIAQLLQREVSDPRLGGLISITSVEVSPDLRFARVFVSIYGPEEERQGAMRALERATPFIRRALREHIPSLRHIPMLSFRRDDSIERGVRVSGLLREASETTAATRRGAKHETGG